MLSWSRPDPLTRDLIHLINARRHDHGDTDAAIDTLQAFIEQGREQDLLTVLAALDEEMAEWMFDLVAEASCAVIMDGPDEDKGAYAVMAASMLLGVLTVLLSPEPAPQPLARARGAGEWLRTALVEPFADFFRRYRWQAALILALIAVYRISDVVMGIMANPFYVDMGYTKDEVAAVTKIYGVVMTLAGAFVGGSLALRFGVMRILMLGALLSALTNLLFAWLAGFGHSVPALIAVVSADNLASGIASAAFVGYLSSLTNISYSATQYALFSSLMLMLPKFVAGFSGDYVNAHGYGGFFVSTALLGLPVLLLVALAARAERQGSAQNKPSAQAGTVP